MIKKVLIHNYRIFRDFTIECNDDLTILVGDNDSGKSTILEAINLALTKRLNGRFAEAELSPNLFNQECTRDYLEGLKANGVADLPRITIELHLVDDAAFAALKGTNNLDGVDCCGVKVEIVFDDDYADEYKELLKKPELIKAVPTEYYKILWYSFANNGVTTRSLGINASFIDATTIRLHSGADHYLQSIINGGLPAKDRAGLAMAFRRLKEHFGNEPAIQEINNQLADRKGAITDRELAIGIDISSKASWETSLIPHLDDIPFHLVGKGEQNAVKVLLALNRRAEDANIVLMEEPENHLSFASMSMLIEKITAKCKGKQVFVTTHSAYVLNKLGIEKVMLLYHGRTTSLKALAPTTYNYFKKLSGYDTLRLILARRVILVEGPSDELVVQKAYLLKHGKLPIADGVDVINVRGLSFKRFLEIAQQLGVKVAVVTDNDGDYEKHVSEKYKAYAGDTNIRLCADKDNTRPTLEPQLVACNGIEVLNRIFGQSFRDAASMVRHMSSDKTEWALRIFETSEDIKMPSYIDEAVA